MAEADWLPELAAHLECDLTRGEGPADMLVVPWEKVSDALDAFDDDIPVPVIWVVPREAGRMELERLADCTPLRRFVFQETAGAVAAAVRELAAHLPGSTGSAVQGEAGTTEVGTEHRTTEPDAGRVPESMDDLWRQFQVTMLDRLTVLEAVGAEILEGDVGRERLADAHHAAHKLHGSLGTFGVRYGSTLAGELEALIEERLDGAELSAGDRYRYSEIVVGLRREIESGRPSDPAKRRVGPPESGDAGGQLLVVESDPDRRQKLAAAGRSRGWRPHPVATPGEALGVLAGGGRPALAVLDPKAGEPDELERLLEELVSGDSPVPVVFQGRTRSLEEQLQTMTVAARVFVDREASPDAVMGRAESLMDRENAGGIRVLVVDDDPDVLRVLTFILRGAGYITRTLSSPLGFWRKLEAVDPDLLLLDVEMPDVHGLQLCRTVRRDARWSDLPILLLTSRAEAGAVMEAFEAGGDDVVPKPVAGPELLARIEHRVRSRTDASADHDGGGTVRERVMERLEIQLAIAARHDEPVTVARIRLEGHDPDATGRATDRLYGRLGDAAEDVDLVARWDRDQLVVARYGETRDPTERWLAGLLPEDTGVRVGLAEHPEYGTPEALLEAAAALDPETAGEDRTAIGEPSGGQGTDIVIVEPDEALGTLVCQTLRDRGYETHWIKDGAEAADLLTGQAPAMRASVIILEVGLPGMDGLSLLRRLARDGVTRRTRVLMLTARSAESEVVKALELGAFDHVPKPFSVSELIHRVRRALGDGEAR